VSIASSGVGCLNAHYSRPETGPGPLQRNQHGDRRGAAGEQSGYRLPPANIRFKPGIPKHGPRLATHLDAMARD
jgi:hypothetical protein